MEFQCNVRIVLLFYSVVSQKSGFERNLFKMKTILKLGESDER